MILWKQKYPGMSFMRQENQNRNLSQYFYFQDFQKYCVSCSTSNDLYDVNSPLVQVTVVPVEIFRRFGTQNLPLFADEEQGTMET